MHTKIYIAMAEAINARWNAYDVDGSVRFGIEEATYGIADVMQADNALFDRTKFLSACFATKES